MTGSDLSRRRWLIAGAALPFALPALAASECAVTPAQTKGPFYPESWDADRDVDLTRLEGHAERADGEVIVVHGRVLGPDCAPLAGAIVDLWQANRQGRYAHSADPNPAPLDPHFQGAGRVVTGEDGRYRFRTIKPGAYALAYLEGRPREDAGFRPPHLHFRVMKRGFGELATQMYFAGDAHQDGDVVMSRLSGTQRASVIITAAPAEADDPDAAPQFAFDLHLAAA